MMHPSNIDQIFPLTLNYLYNYDNIYKQAPFILKHENISKTYILLNAL